MSITIDQPEQTVATLVHPNYDATSLDWFKWRLTYVGGRLFKQRYLAKFSTREDDEDYQQRLAYSYSPSFAKGAINDVKNAIFSRMVDITRVNGTPSLMEAIEGKNGGVDLTGRSMNTFMGQLVLPELATMGRVGVFIDNPKDLGATLSDNINKRPYLYVYTAENIRSWVFDQKKQLRAILLRDYTDEYEKDTGLPVGQAERFRRMWIAEDGFVHVIIYDDKGKPISEEVVLKLREIPFAWLEITESLLTDIADYQIAMLNLASSNVGYALKSNFPFYVEEYDPRSEVSFLKPVTVNMEDDTDNATGLSGAASRDQSKEIKVGTTHGRRYPKDTKAPGFIHPSPEPLDISMKLADKMKEEIRQLLNLTLSSLEPKFASAESKDRDQLGLESGLSYIGLELENAERKIARVWATYEGKSETVATIKYPERYSLKTDAERKEEANSLKDLRGAIPSRTGQKELSKRIADVLLSHKVSYDTLVKINKEIDASQYLGTDAKDISIDVEQGLVSRETASNARGYDGPKEVPIAKQEHVDRLAAIAEAQAEVKSLRDGDAEGLANATGAQQDVQGNAGRENKDAKKQDGKDPTAPQKKRGDGKASNK